MDALLTAEQKGWGAERLLFKLEQVVDPDSERLIYARGKSWIRNLSPGQFSIERGMPGDFSGDNSVHSCLEWDLEERLNQAAAIRTVDECWRELPFSRYSINQKDGKLELPSKSLRIGKDATIGLGIMKFFTINKLGRGNRDG